MEAEVEFLFIYAGKLQITIRLHNNEIHPGYKFYANYCLDSHLLNNSTKKYKFLYINQMIQ
ncbi:MAG: hypothetical protein ACYCX2_11265 [Christensenellales bacterium]